MAQVHETRAQAFETLCAPYSGMVYRHCLHMLHDPHEAEDAAQETMLRAFRAFDRFRGKGVASWLFTIAHNTCLDVLKSARMRAAGPALEAYEQAHGQLADPAAPPDERWEQAQGDEALRRAVLALKPEQQLLLALYYGQGMAYADICAATGMGEGTVKSRLSRARDALRRTLAQDGNQTQG